MVTRALHYILILCVLGDWSVPDSPCPVMTHSHEYCALCTASRVTNRFLKYGRLVCKCFTRVMSPFHVYIISSKRLQIMHTSASVKVGPRLYCVLEPILLVATYAELHLLNHITLRRAFQLPAITISYNFVRKK